MNRVQYMLYYYEALHLQARHENVCAKSLKKRKPLDMSKQRARGTDLESYKVTQSTVTKKSEANPISTEKTSSWRRKHEDFIQSIRAAKDMNHLLKSGK